MALDIRQSVFGGNNLHVAIANEDLAYASYVLEYSSGSFDAAKWVTAVGVCMYISTGLYVQFDVIITTISNYLHQQCGILVVRVSLW